MPMEQPTEEQTIPFWEKLGVKLIQESELKDGHIDCEYWLLPNGETMGGLPSIDILSLINIAIPILQNEGYRIDIQCLEHKGYRVLIYKVATDVLVAKVSDDDLGLALFGAIWEVIK